MCSVDIFLGLLAILFPPLPVWVKRGICSADSLINILLCIVGFIPGLIHSWYIIAKYPDPGYDYEGLPQEEGVAPGPIYVFVHSGSAPAPPPQANMNYGATNADAPSTQTSGAPAPGAAGPSSSQNAGGDHAPPPSYAQVVAGDHKVQNHD
ncbi:hypothetical protein VTK73DRAFT_867 [Phialemonium thermophilum]|uniref:Stress response RCI peptide n=1 Tax=Phialemonium thermophilum TaxID=223376 RepID=A0ABR3VU70_9PEZI